MTVNVPNDCSWKLFFYREDNTRPRLRIRWDFVDGRTLGMTCYVEHGGIYRNLSLDSTVSLGGEGKEYIFELSESWSKEFMGKPVNVYCNVSGLEYSIGSINVPYGETSYVHKTPFCTNPTIPTPYSPVEPVTPTPVEPTGHKRTIVLKFQVVPFPFVTMGLDVGTLISNKLSFLINEISKILGSQYQIVAINYNRGTSEIEIVINELGTPVIPIAVILLIMGVIALIGLITVKWSEYVDDVMVKEENQSREKIYNDTYNACISAGGSHEQCVIEASGVTSNIYGEPDDSKNGGFDLTDISKMFPLIVMLIVLSMLSGLVKK